MFSKYRKEIFVVIILLATIVLFHTIPIASAQSIEILSHSGFVDAIGYYHIAGEIQNIGSNNLQFVEITATFYNESHVVIGTSFTYTSLEVVLQGRKSPFEIILVYPDQAAKVDHYSLTVSSYSLHSGSKPLNLQILSNSSYIDVINYHHIVGEIKNLGSTATTFVEISATYYNSTGHVIATAFTYANPDTINAEATSPFEIILVNTERTSLVSKYDLTAESIQFAIIPEFSSWLILLILLPTLTGLLLVFRKRLPEYRETIGL